MSRSLRPGGVTTKVVQYAPFLNTQLNIEHLYTSIYAYTCHEPCTIQTDVTIHPHRSVDNHPIHSCTYAATNPCIYIIRLYIHYILHVYIMCDIET